MKHNLEGNRKNERAENRFTYKMVLCTECIDWRRDLLAYYEAVADPTRALCSANLESGSGGRSNVTDLPSEHGTRIACILPTTADKSLTSDGQ